MSSSEANEINLRYGPLPSFPQQQRYARIVMILSMAVITFFNLKNDPPEVVFASRQSFIKNTSKYIICSDLYREEISNFKGCEPYSCGRAVFDNVISNEEKHALLDIAKRCLSLMKEASGASIVDLHSGALGSGKNFVNLYKLKNLQDTLTDTDFKIYKAVRAKIQQHIINHFSITQESLHLTYPTFFSRLTNATPIDVHDEYWHIHVDKETYESFHYTSILYLNDYGDDFTGGRFHFVETDNKSTVIEPRGGRLSIFTSGSENPHFVERVKSGERFAITVSFSCDPTKGIVDPNFQ